ncbi:HNH endonuclease [[Ruminococcus] lactaris]|uniref:HNH endonuclease n=1 Tax=[Ruminococcus] lactaris TaxID=46228 RepID=UPI00189D3043|nr:HNH endonuclease signature motif containing protein [[Ruminococcus] lactaris]
MPRKPMKPCCHPDCPKLTEGRYCEEHEALHRGERKSASGRGYNSKWQRARKRFLKEHPLCCKCEEEGKYVRATIVDHIKPHRGDPILFWDEENWQPLCKHHHDVKTMTEDRYQKYRY